MGSGDRGGDAYTERQSHHRSHDPYAWTPGPSSPVDGATSTSYDSSIGDQSDYLVTHLADDPVADASDPDARCPHPRPWRRLRAKQGFTHFSCRHCNERWRVWTGQQEPFIVQPTLQ
jgi:hypothetical protein